MSTEFVSLADRLAGIESCAAAREEPHADAGDDRIGSALGCRAGDAPADAVERSNETCAEALRDARLFRARLADAFAEAAQHLLRELACEVLARELRLAPCDLAALVQRVRERVPVVRVRVAAADLGAVTGVPLLADPALQAGDAIVELAGGALDARLGVRLAAVLEAFA